MCYVTLYSNFDIFVQCTTKSTTKFSAIRLVDYLSKNYLIKNCLMREIIAIWVLTFCLRRNFFLLPKEVQWVTKLPSLLNVTF